MMPDEGSRWGERRQPASRGISFLLAGVSQALQELLSAHAHSEKNLLMDLSTCLSGYFDSLPRQVGESAPVAAQIGDIRRLYEHLRERNRNSTHALLENPRAYVDTQKRYLMDLSDNVARILGFLPSAYRESEEVRRLLNRITDLFEGLRRTYEALEPILPNPHPSGDRKLIDVVNATEALCARPFYAAKVTFSAEIDRDAQDLEVPYPFTATILVNLLMNAVDAVRSCQDRERRVAVVGMKRGQMLEIEVRDNGVGIPDHLKDQIWNAGFTTGANRTGLGLTVVKQLTERCGGRAWMESISGQGSNFHISIPVEGGRS